MSDEQSNVLSSTTLGISIAEVLKKPDSKNISRRILIAIAGEPKVFTKNNSTEEYLDIPVGDATDLMDMRAWDSVELCKKNFVPGSVWSLNVTKTTWNDKPQITFQAGDSRLIASSINDLLLKEGGDILAKTLRRAYEPVPDFIAEMAGVMTNSNLGSGNRTLINPLDPTPAKIAGRIFGFNTDWLTIYETVVAWKYENPEEESELKLLDTAAFENLFESAEAYQVFKRYYYAPAAKGYHGNFLHGLIAHSHGMRGLVDALEIMAKNSPTMHLFKDENGHTLPFNSADSKLDLNLLEVLCYIHDFYKYDEYVWTDIGGISYREPGHPFYHDLRIAFKLQTLKAEFGIPERENSIFDKMAAILMTHHGQWSEYTPDRKRITYPECNIFHFIDNLEAKTTEALERT